MVTGVETAGLVLATFPLIIEGLKFYLRGMETIRRWRRNTYLIHKLIRTMVMEQRKFKNNMTILLWDLATKEELESWLEDPKFIIRREVQSGLREQLGPSFGVFSATVDDITGGLEELKKILELNDEGRPIWDEKGSSFKREWKRLRLSLEDESVRPVLDGLRNNNDDLNVLMRQCERLKNLSNQKLGIPKYDRIRDHAQTLYSALNHSLTRSCGCLVAHTASLQLEIRNGDKHAQGYCGFRPKFNVLFNFETHSTTQVVPWNWCDTVIESSDDENPKSDSAPLQDRASGSVSAPTITQTASDVRSPPATTSRFSLTRAVRSPQSRDRARVTFEIPLENRVLVSRTRPSYPPMSERVNCLCTAICRKLDKEPYLGFLASETGLSRLHNISLTGADFRPSSTRTVPLADLLSPTLHRKNRLSLAVKLASALLQLYKTPWLNEMWGKQDIFFVEQQGDSIDSILQKPFISRPFASPTCPPDQTRRRALTPSISVGNQSTIGLGVLLIELWLGKTIEDLRIPADTNGREGPDHTADLTTATRLLKDIYRDAGEPYGNAVRQCLHSDFGSWSVSLEDRAVKMAVHQEVVMSLMRYHELFADKKLDGISLT